MSQALAPEIPALSEPAVLVFTKTNGFRHYDAIDAGSAALEEIAARRGWSFLRTENGAAFEAGILARFRVVVWLNASGAPLSGPQRDAFRDWLEGGGGFVGIHAALDGSHEDFQWYYDEVVAAPFIGHAIEHQVATVKVESPGHPAMQALGAKWRHLDEWYSFSRSVRGDDGVEVLATVDESTFDPRLKLLWIDEDLSMGDHPVVWTRTVGRGGAFLCALGHVGEAYRDPTFLSILEGGIEWAGAMASGGAGN